MNFSPEFTRKYAIQRVLGEGGMSRVYLAREVELSRVVAIKFIQLAAGVADGLPERLLEEARVCAAIKHPNVVRVYGDGTEQGAPFVVFEYVAGCSLAQELKAHGVLPIARMSVLIRGVLSGLQAAHELGIVHRDIKPANILLHADSGEPMLMDFGVAKASAGRQVTTQAGMLLGTPAYMAPELIMGEAVTPAVDVYAVGIMLYECLAGTGPFQATNDVQLLSMHVHVAPPDLTEAAPDVSPAIAAIVARALAKDPKERYENAGAMLAALDNVLSASGTRVVVPPSVVAAARALAPEPTSDTTPTARISTRTASLSTPARHGSRPDRTGPISRDRSVPVSRAGSAVSPGSTTREVRVARRRKRLALLALIALAPALLIGLGVAWFMDQSVREVHCTADDDGHIEATWQTRHASRGWVGVLPRAVRGSTVTTREAKESEDHHALVSGLAPGPYGVAVLAPDGQPVWSETVVVPPRAAARTSAPRAPGGPWEVTVPADGASAGYLRTPGAKELRSVGTRDGLLWFEAAWPASGPPPETVVTVDPRPGHTLRYRVNWPREVAVGLAAAVAKLDLGRLAGEMSRLATFNNRVELTLAGHMKDPKLPRFADVLRERLGREGVWPHLAAFTPLADGFFAHADPAVARAVYERLLDLEALEALVLSQHEPVSPPVRQLYRQLVQVEHRSDWMAPAAAEPGAVKLSSAAQLWAPIDWEGWDLFGLWLTENPHIAVLTRMPALTNKAIRTACIASSSYAPPELARLRGARAVRFRMVFALLGPGYYYRVRFRGDGTSSFPLHVGHAANEEWFSAMDHKRPSSVPETPKGTPRPPRIYWGEYRATFPAHMLPLGKLAVEVSHEHVPGVKITDLSYPGNKASVVQEITVAPVQ